MHSPRAHRQDHRAKDRECYARAIESGLCEGPRIVRSGRALSQTGGHGDLSPDHGALCACQIGGNDLAHIADGADAVRLAARSELRDGSAFTFQGKYAKPTARTLGAAIDLMIRSFTVEG